MLFGKIIAIKMCRLESQTYNSSLKVIQWLTSPGSWFYWNRFLGYQNFRALQLSHPFWNFIPEIYLTQTRLDRLLAFDSLVPTWHPLLMCLPRSPWPMESPSLLSTLFVYPRSSKEMFHMSSYPSLERHPIWLHEMDHGYIYGVETHERHWEG